jgi:2',3'-cyclic-nucleotide 2'-phosphodiesterase (5'-nucleotidase family)
MYRWEATSMDGSRTGCTATTADNVSEAVGKINDDGSYVSPSGNVYAKESATAKTASIVIKAQPKMAEVKKVIAKSDEYMPNGGRENRLSNWFVNIIMDKVSSLSGRKVDVGICNFGGIRSAMPQGDVTLDDIKSMFPFKNYLVYLELSGKELRNIVEKMAAGTFQAMCGAEVVVSDKKVETFTIGGRPVEDDKLYSVATISFLLHGGDGLSLADNAVNIINYDVMIMDAVLERIYALSAEGKSIKGSDVRYVTIK